MFLQQQQQQDSLPRGFLCAMKLQSPKGADADHNVSTIDEVNSGDYGGGVHWEWEFVQIWFPLFLLSVEKKKFNVLDALEEEEGGGERQM